MYNAGRSADRRSARMPLALLQILARHQFDVIIRYVHEAPLLNSSTSSKIGIKVFPTTNVKWRGKKPEAKSRKPQTPFSVWKKGTGEQLMEPRSYRKNIHRIWKPPFPRIPPTTPACPVQHLACPQPFPQPPTPFPHTPSTEYRKKALVATKMFLTTCMNQ